ncbi:MAG: phospholipid carrier-dependent glycosyltransferase, partial [Cyanobacteriota bacterium]|nr:phospholipid carrier-dependent glycosyltransferase [Cyanobacteriota bacterium]
MTAIFVISAALRFWQLGRFNTLVFDEVYYAKFANNYLTQTEFFNAHPPLSQYLIAIGIWIGSHLPFGQEVTNDLTGSDLAPWTYRWLNALTGSFIPVVVGAIAYQLTRRSSYALISSLLIAADGLFLVESRYALNNIYLVIFGLLGHLCLFVALKARKNKRWIWLTGSGIFCGLSAAIKWNGLGFILGLFLVFIVAVIIDIVIFLKQDRQFPNPARLARVRWRSPLSKLPLLGLARILLTLAFLPVLCYSLIWIPHLILNPEFDFLEMQKQIMGYHQSIEDGTDVHPYCSQWYSWLLMVRPIVYFYKNTAT